MAPLKFVVKYFSEIATKSKAVRHVSGITYILEVREHPLPLLNEIVEHARPSTGNGRSGPESLQAIIGLSLAKTNSV